LLTCRGGIWLTILVAPQLCFLAGCWRGGSDPTIWEWI
jgi:hypothetical protein